MQILDGAGGAAQLVLNRYDRVAGAFVAERAGEFWDAVALAHAQGRRGQGRTIAIVDTGFDPAYPAIAAMHSAGDPALAGGATTHGTAVALLVHDVAPEADILLYGVARDGGIDRTAVVDAVDDARSRGADILNLSMGEKYPFAEVFDGSEMLSRPATWESSDPADTPYLLAMSVARGRGWRDLLTLPPTTAIDDAVARAMDAGTTVVAACGNDDHGLYSPAIRRGVVSVSFLLAERSADEGLRESARAARPFGFAQTTLSDIALLQPPLTLGTSFAAPLMSGFAALMPDRSTVPGHLETLHISALASALLPDFDGRAPGWQNRWRVLDGLFRHALASLHPHRGDAGCPECSVFAAPAHIDAGLFWLESGRLDDAEHVLSRAVAFAPGNPHAKANLGMTLGAKASRSLEADDPSTATALLPRAARLMAAAAALRPEQPAYAARAAEFSRVAADPGSWRIGPDPRS